MPGDANITDVGALDEFRRALIRFREELNAALAEAIFEGVQQYFVDHPPDGSRFALERKSGGADADRTVIATAPDSSGPAARPPGRL